MRDQVMRLMYALVATTLYALANAAEPPRDDVASAIEALETKLDAALQGRDREQLDALLATPFTWVHTSGIVDRATWLDQAAQGRAFTRQRRQMQELDSSISMLSNNTALRTARLRFRTADNSVETWMIQSRVYVKQDGAWKLAAGQGARMYEGPPVDAQLYGRYAGRYELPDGRELKIDWDGTSMFALFPNGNRYQIFLKSPTEEATIGASKLRFELDAQGVPVTAMSMTGDSALWRARRK